MRRRERGATKRWWSGRAVPGPIWAAVCGHGGDAVCYANGGRVVGRRLRQLGAGTAGAAGPGVGLGGEGVLRSFGGRPQCICCSILLHGRVDLQAKALHATSVRADGGGASGRRYPSCWRRCGVSRFRPTRGVLEAPGENLSSIGSWRRQRTGWASPWSLLALAVRLVRTGWARGHCG